MAGNAGSRLIPGVLPFYVQLLHQNPMLIDPPPVRLRMPAEWEPHEATWIAWPHNKDDWPGKFGPIPWIYADIVKHLHYSERVRILVNGTGAERRARDILQRTAVDLSRIDFFRAATNRVWTRDYGPIFVRDEAGSLALTDWRFNAWAKYDDWQRDDAVPGKLARALKLPAHQPHVGPARVVLEGGSIDVNGAGLLLTTEECLLSPIQQRNPGLTQADLERVFEEYLGIRKVLWLGRGIAGDDTHGHIDDLARFVAPRTVVTVVEEDPNDANFEVLQENLARLQRMSDLDDHPLEVATLPMPAPLFFDGQRLPASYANFYIANDRVLMPTFNDPNDRRALGTLASLFPGRKIVGIHAVDLVWGLGTLHCLTQQQPAP
jgi:agmatine deiminase